MSYAIENIRKAKVLAILDQLETKGDVKNSILESFKSLAIGLVGAGVGAAVGKPSLIAGFVATMIGHYMDQPRLSSLGVGMIASGGYQVASAAKTSVSGLDGVKERIQAFSDNIKNQLYLDKFIKPKATGINGLGEVQYFKYPSNNNSTSNELDMGALDALEDEINLSGDQYEEQVSGAIFDDEMSGLEDEPSY